MDSYILTSCTRDKIARKNVTEKSYLKNNLSQVS